MESQMQPWFIKGVDMTNFRAFRRVAVETKPLNVLIGPNDSGKSTFLSAIYRLWLSVNDSKEPTHAFTDSDRRDGTRLPFTVRLRTGGRDATYQSERGRSQCAPSVEPFRGKVIHLLRLEPRNLLTIEAGASDTSPVPPLLSESGAGVARFLDYVLRRDRGRFDTVISIAKERYVPWLRDIQIATPKPDTRELRFHSVSGQVFSSNEVSDGVKYLFYFLALAHHPTPPSVILLEEPETGLHPTRLAEVMNLLREMTMGALGGSPVQMFLTTHSPYLVDYVDSDKDQILVFKRDEADKTNCTVAEIARDKIRPLLKQDFRLGEIWQHEGEAEIVK